ncbi:hypothetical protein NDU88_011771 [Pleurodeles waltl]|uniref:Uncharacterized protein n=1 Tax=Pleurodeles waltl TaxID=8319 RepID=A0AAV7QZQ6_PLEWA|nr:hypothetical protein NDU88_011771 [Pleurodeles waltl]
MVPQGWGASGRSAGRWLRAQPRQHTATRRIVVSAMTRRWTSWNFWRLPALRVPVTNTTPTAPNASQSDSAVDG